MRELKFRYVCYNKHFKELSLEYLTDDLLREQDHVPSWILSDNCEIRDKQLCTGLKDKNGKEIYEGDIIESPSRNKHIVPDDILEFAWWIMEFFDDAKDWLTVIGNIYENPELIK